MFACPVVARFRAGDETPGQSGIAGEAGRRDVRLFLALFMTLDAMGWYARFGWIDERPSGPSRRNARSALAWLESHRDVAEFLGDYWDVYRLSFLAESRVHGIPFPVYPNRFPQWSSQLRKAASEPARAAVSGRQRVSRRGDPGRGGRAVSGSRALIVSWP